MRILAFAYVSVLLMVSGCDSMPDRVRDRFAAPQPQIRVFNADQRTVYEAAQRAVRSIGFHITRHGEAKGLINAMSEIQPANALGEARQYALEVKLQSYESGRTEVAVVFREQQESSSFAGATDLPLRDHGLYDSYFNALEAGLPVKAPAEPAVPVK